MPPSPPRREHRSRAAALLEDVSFDPNTYVGATAWTGPDGLHVAKPTGISLYRSLRFNLNLEVSRPRARRAMTYVSGTFTASGIVIDVIPHPYADTPLRATLEAAITPAYLAAGLSAHDRDAWQGSPTLPAVTVNLHHVRDQLRAALAHPAWPQRALALAMVQAGFDGTGAELEAAVAAATDTTMPRAHGGEGA